MLITSLAFVGLFLPVSIGTLVFARRISGSLAHVLLGLFSLAFYLLSASYSALAQVMGSIALNYLISARLSASREGPLRKRLFLLGLSANLVLLVSHKLAATFWSILAPGSTPYTAPLGVSYLTIMQVIVLVDAYQGVWKTPTPWTYWNFVSFFPQLTAGPISAQYYTLPQFCTYASRPVDASAICQGVMVLALGLFKKAVVADTLGGFVDTGYSQLEALSGAEAWLTCIAYFFQIFLDFSGCSDIAVGIGLMLGILLPFNFERPYRCTTIVRFWQEWHMSLTSFVTNYFYTPLIREWGRFSFARTMAATWLAMVVVGLWHGFNLTYLVFGLYHGFGIVVYHIGKKLKAPTLPAPLAWLATMLFVLGSYLPLRAGSLGGAASMLRALLGVNAGGHTMAHFNAFDRVDWLIVASAFGLGIYFSFYCLSTRELLRAFRLNLRCLLTCVVMFVVAVVFLNSSREANFIYANF